MRLSSARHAASTSGSAISASYVTSCHLTVEDKERTPSGCGTRPGVPELNAHVRQTHHGRNVGGHRPIAQHGINNLVGGWAVVCLRREFEERRYHAPLSRTAANRYVGIGAPRDCALHRAGGIWPTQSPEKPV